MYGPRFTTNTSSKENKEEKNVKKFLAMIVVLTMIMSLTACSKGNEGQTSEKSTASTPSSTLSSEESTSEASQQEETYEPVKIRAAYHPGLPGSITPGIDSIEGNHFFEKYGLEVEWVKFTSGPPEVAAMVSNDIQFGYIGHGAHTLAAEGNINIISMSHVGNSERIFVRNDSGIEKLEDLKGKTIATQLGTSGEVILDLALKSVGMSKDDVNVVNMDMSGAVAAFIAGQTDAIACWDTHAANVTEQVGEENLTLLAETSQFKDITAFPASWTATPKYIEENHDVVIRFILALYDIYQYRYTNFDDAIKVTAEFNDQTFEDFDKTRDNFIAYNPEETNQMLDDGSLLEIYQLQLDYLIENDKVESGDVNEYVRIDLMKEAMEEWLSA